MNLAKIIYIKLFSQPESIGRIFWPSRKELNYFKNFSKKFLKSRVFFIGATIFFLNLIFDILVKAKIPSEGVLATPFFGIYLVNFFHPFSKIVTFFGILLILRILAFLRFKTYWRNNIFFDLGFGMLFGAILARIKDFKGAVDWIQVGGMLTNFVDIVCLLGILFLLIGIIICPKRHESDEN